MNAAAEQTYAGVQAQDISLAVGARETWLIPYG